MGCPSKPFVVLHQLGKSAMPRSWLSLRSFDRPPCVELGGAEWPRRLLYVPSIDRTEYIQYIRTTIALACLRLCILLLSLLQRSERPSHEVHRDEQ